MLDMKYRWIRRPAPYTSVKPDVNHNLNQQGEYINRIKKKTLNATTRQCPSIPKQSCNLSCDLFKTRTSMKAGIDNFTKTVGPIDQSDYVKNTNDQCIMIDEQFQKEMNTKPSSTPFGC